MCILKQYGQLSYQLILNTPCTQMVVLVSLIPRLHTEGMSQCGLATRFYTKVITWKYSLTRPSPPSYLDHLSCKQTGYGGNAIASYPSFSSHPLFPPMHGKRKCYERKEEMSQGTRLAMCPSYGLSTFVFFTFRALRGYSTKKTNNPIGLWRMSKGLAHGQKLLNTEDQILWLSNVHIPY